MIPYFKFKYVIIMKTFKSLIISISLFRDIELHRLLHVENNHKLHRSIGCYAHLLFLLVQSMFLGLLVLRKDRVSEWLQNYDVRTSIIGCNSKLCFLFSMFYFRSFRCHWTKIQQKSLDSNLLVQFLLSKIILFQWVVMNFNALDQHILPQA